MASVMAIVAKAAWDELSKRAGRDLGEGDVAPLDRYTSANKALSKLADGGALFLVTVRPPDERLWLVAILESPRFERDAWLAEANATPIRDVTALIPALRFATGKGLAPKPGALAMSLQTPRELTPEDEARLRGAARPSPGAAFQAAMLDIEAAKPRKKRSLTAAAGPPPTPRGPSVADLEAADRGGAAALSEVPLPWREALASLDTWRGLAEAPRRQALDELTHDLAAADPRHDFEVLSARVGAAGLGALRHRPSGTEVIAVPGGRFVMGYTADDALAVWLAIPMPGDDDDDDIEAGELDHELRRARPAHLVTLRPFLLARRATTQDSLFAAAGLPKKQGVAAAVSALGWRFASEAEWEWMAREGGAVRFVGLPPNAHPLRPTLAPPAREPNGWGFEGLLNEQETVADAWHDDYRGAPSDGSAWEPAKKGERATRFGHTWWQGNEECVALHAAYRCPGPGKTRLALSLPDAAPPAFSEPFAWEATLSGAIAALSSRGAGDRERGRRALDALAIHPGEDADELARIATPLLAAATGDDARLAWLLALLTRVAKGRPEARALLAPQEAAVAALRAGGSGAVKKAAGALLKALGG